MTLTSEEVDRLLATVRTGSTTGLRNRAMFAVMLGAGLRVSEVVALRGVDVDLQRGEVRVNLGKGGRDRVVPVHEETLAWLRAWSEKRKGLELNGRAPFFVGLRFGRTGSGERKRGDGLGVRFVQGLVTRLGEAAGIDKRVTPHTLRHTYATRLLEGRFTIREVQTLLGHSNVSTTQVYTHVNDEELRAKVQGQAVSGVAALREKLAEGSSVEVLRRALSGLNAEQRAALVEALTEGSGD